MERKEEVIETSLFDAYKHMYTSHTSFCPCSSSPTPPNGHYLYTNHTFPPELMPAGSLVTYHREIIYEFSVKFASLGKL